ncbi:MAG: hypothetical protein SFV54_14345 [Bryobacteraceae bacterium]|nr:hypothetical protein [Bryobacteraceae bacterium]
MLTTAQVPYIDPDVQHVGVSKLREYDGKALRQLEKKAVVLRDRDQPVAVLLSYETYLVMQDQYKTIMETLEVLSSNEEVELLIRGLSDAREGRSRSLEEIRQSLRAKTGL